MNPNISPNVILAILPELLHILFVFFLLARRGSGVVGKEKKKKVTSQLLVYQSGEDHIRVPLMLLVAAVMQIMVLMELGISVLMSKHIPEGCRIIKKQK